MARFGLDDVQAQAICDMRLISLQGLNREKLEAEYKELEKKIAYYKELLADPEKIRAVLETELFEIRDKYGDERKTEIEDVWEDIDDEDLIAEEDCVFTLTHNGYIKRLQATEYNAQRRGGKGVKAMTTREEDYVETVFAASTHDSILFFTNFGKVYIRKGYKIPRAERNARGSNIVNILPLDPGEKIATMLHARGLDEDRCIVMLTKDGTVKRMAQNALKNIRSTGIRAITLDEGDELISVRQTSGDENVFIATHDGMAICFAEDDVRPMGRTAVGVRGIRLREGDYVVGAGTSGSGAAILSITENGYGKRTLTGEYTLQHRGGMGLKNYNVTEKTGAVVDMKIVNEEDDLLVVSDDGTIIRMAVSDISVLGRSTQGVRVMRVGDGARVISIARTDKEETEEGDEIATDAATEEDEVLSPDTDNQE